MPALLPRLLLLLLSRYKFSVVVNLLPSDALNRSWPLTRSTAVAAHVAYRWSFRRFNRKTRNVELKSSKHTEDASALQKTADFIQAFMLGFEVQVGGALRYGVEGPGAAGARGG